MILLLSDDLIFSSKISATACAHGLALKTVKSVESFEGLAGELKPSAIILDLDHSAFDVAELISRLSPRPRVIAYGSHVNRDRLNSARHAGCDFVLPRSKFVGKLESDLIQWTTAPSPE